MIRYSFRVIMNGLCKRSNLLLFVTVLLTLCLLTDDAIAQSTPTDNETKMQQYNAQAVGLINTREFDEALPFIRLALQQKENGLSYYYLCHINAVQNNWDSAIYDGEKSIQLNPSFLPVYPDLFYCYTKLGKWEKAKSISEQVKSAGTNGSSDQLLNDLDKSMDNDLISKILLTLFFLSIGIAFLMPNFKADQKATVPDGKDTFRFTEVFLLSAAVSCVFWMVFYHFSQWIWSFNIHPKFSEVTQTFGIFIVEHDGMESFVLYMIMFANILSTLILTRLLAKFRSKRNLYIGVFSFLFLVSAYYFFSLKFIPPMLDKGEQGASKFPLIFFALSVLGGGLFFLRQKYSIVVKGIVVLLLSYACLVMIVPSVLVDMSFMLCPAVRMMNGVKIHDIYFQYDLFLSFVALAWLKLNLSMESFPYIGQLSYLIFFIVSFFFTDRFFKSKGLSVLFIISYVIIRYYAIWEPGAGVIQVTPIRLDLWMIPLIIAYRKGIKHWLVGFSLGLLVLFHRNLGLIYLGAYAELLIVLFVADAIALLNNKDFSVKSVSTLLIKYLKENMINVILIISSIALCFILFQEMFSPSALNYRKIGVGMIRISKISFYWYVPVTLSCLSVLLFRFREKLGERYTVTGLFIVIIAVGESMYFFGRSHENGILTVSGGLILVMFVLFDILIFQSPDAVATEQVQPKIKGKQDPQVKKRMLNPRRIYWAIPFLFMFLSGYYYSGRLAEKVDIQYTNFQEGQYVCPLLPMPMDTTAIRHITNNSPNVFFLDFDTDFYYYYYGHYMPIGYFNPCEAWIYRKDLIKFMQDLIDKHYYIVYNARKYNSFPEYIPHLKYNQLNKENDMVSVSKADVAFLLPESKSTLLHVAMKDTLSPNGMDYTDFELKSDFTIEIVVKPTRAQSQNSSILNNFSRVNQLTGLTLQASGAPGQYVLAYGTGLGMPNTMFSLEENKWHYLVILFNKNVVNIYDNGKLLTSVNTGGKPFVNSSIPLTIGNNATRDGRFYGYVREVKITEGNIAEAEIANTNQKLEAALMTGK